MDIVRLLSDIQHLGPFVYLLVLAISFLESWVCTGMFVPGTMVIVITGGFASHGFYSYWLLVFFAALGAVLGDGISYELGCKGGMRLSGDSIIKRHIDRAKPFFQRHQRKSVLLGRFVGPLRPVIPFLAGVADMQRPLFYAVDATSAVAWSIFYVGIGYVFGTAWKLALILSSRLLVFILFAFVLLTVFAWIWRWTIAQGKPYAVAFLQFFKGEWRRVLLLPLVHSWTKRHSTLIAFTKDRFHKRLLTGLPLTMCVLAVVFAFILFVGIAEDVFTGEPLSFLDARFEHLLYVFRTPELLSFFYGVTQFGDWRAVAIGALTLSVILWRKKMQQMVAALWFTILTSDAVLYIAKLLFHRPRPDSLLPAIREDSFSFPSTHAAVTVSFYGFIAYLLIRGNAEWKKRVSAFFDVLFVVILIDISRLYLGVHYLSDVLAGNMIGFMILLTAVSLSEWMLSRSKVKIIHSLAWNALFIILVAEAAVITLLLILSPARWTPGVPVRDSRPIVERNVLPLFADRSLPSFAESLFSRQQLPISVILIGDTRCMLQALDRAHWRRSDELSIDAAIDMAKAILLDEEFTSPPLTPSFYNSYPQDFGYSKDMGSSKGEGIDRIRLWQTPYATEHGNVFVATVTLDRRTKWTLMHSIDPNIDSERTLLLQNLLATKTVRRFRVIHLLPALDRKTYASDGKAVLMELRSCPGPG